MKKETPRAVAQQGFTLIEMIVSTAIFMVAMLIIMSTLIGLTNESRKARAIRTEMDNLSAAMESMSRTMRMGKNFYCDCATIAITDTPFSTHNCRMKNTTGTLDIANGSGGTCVQFIDQQNRNVRYEYNAAGKYISMSTFDGVTALTNQRLTAPEIIISRMNFFVGGADPTDKRQSYVTFIVGGSAGVRSKDLTTFNLQSTVSIRTPNFIP